MSDDYVKAKARADYSAGKYVPPKPPFNIFSTDREFAETHRKEEVYREAWLDKKNEK